MKIGIIDSPGSTSPPPPPTKPTILGEREISGAPLTLNHAVIIPANTSMLFVWFGAFSGTINTPTYGGIPFTFFSGWSTTGGARIAWGYVLNPTSQTLAILGSINEALIQLWYLKDATILGDDDMSSGEDQTYAVTLLPNAVVLGGRTYDRSSGGGLTPDAAVVNLTILHSFSPTDHVILSFQNDNPASGTPVFQANGDWNNPGSLGVLVSVYTS